MVAAVTVDPGVRLAVLQETKYSSTKWVRVAMRAGEMGREEEEMAARTWALAAVNSGVRLAYWSVWGVGLVEGVEVEERDVVVKAFWVGEDGLVKATLWVLRLGDTNALLVLSNEDTRVSTIAVAFRPNFILNRFLSLACVD